MKKIALITASLALLAVPAFAEDAKTTGTAPAEAKFSTVSKDEMFSSKLKGLNVYNQKDESVGEITDLAIKNHQVDALILSVGGFLGMGEHYVAVPMEKLKWVNEPVRTSSTTTAPADKSTVGEANRGNRTERSASEKWYPDHAVFNTTKDQLKAMPQFKYD